MKKSKVSLTLLFLSLFMSSFSHATAGEIVLATYNCTVPRSIGTSMDDQQGEVSGTSIQIQKRQLGAKIYFVYLQNVYPAFGLVDQGVFEDIGQPWGRTRAGLINVVKDKNIFLASGDYMDLLESKILRVTRVTLQDYSICELKESK